MFLFGVGLLLCFTSVLGKITDIPLPDDMRHCFNTAQKQPATVGEVIFTRCVKRILWRRQAQPETKPLGDDAKQWISGLVDMTNLDIAPTSGGLDLAGTGSGTAAPPRRRRQAGPQVQPQPNIMPRRQPRIRKEYRQLSEVERMLFHRSINMLKADTTVAPNKYDALGRLHLLSVGRAHFGPNFLPWHRLFLVVMENALREKIPTVTIPYWDTTLDDELRDPRSSVVWTPEFLGTANGFLTEGPFANWQTPTGPLLRQFGMAGTMLNWTYIHNAFRQNHIANITFPLAHPDNNIEEHHNQVHLWIGGQMTPPSLAAFDPVFYLLHSYVDLLWEIFRGLQKRRGIDPTTDYPLNDKDIPPEQRYNDSSGFGTLLVRHGLSNVFTDNIYKYDRPPTCTRQIPDCGSRHIHCDLSGPHPKCVSASIFDIKELFTAGGLPMSGGSGIRELRSTSSKARRKQAKLMSAIDNISQVKCQATNVNEKVINSFTLDGVTDQERWAYIPVQIIYKNNKGNLNASTRVNDLCMKGKTTEIPTRVFVEANGLSYEGGFKEVTHFRNALGADASLTYVGVRKPTTEKHSEVMLSAYDMCGRVCQPYCLDRTGNHNRKCSGSIKISRQVPFMYGNDVTSVTNTIWQEDINGLPKLADYEIFMRFVCDTTVSFWPW